MPHLRYEQHTWPELAELATRDDVVVVIPTATLEDHGHHLPIDTDVRLIEEVARGACERVNARRRHGAALPDRGARLHAAPPRLPRHGDAALERLRRVPARHRPLALPPRLRPHPHGQRPRLQPAARRHRRAPRQRRAPLGDLRLVLVPRRRPSPRRCSRSCATPGRGGMAHACELETSLYLAIEPGLVQMERAVKEIPPQSEFMWMDWSDGPLSYMPHWSALSQSGVTGDATAATAEKGSRWLARAQDEIARFHPRRARPGAPAAGRSPPLGATGTFGKLGTSVRCMSLPAAIALPRPRAAALARIAWLALPAIATLALAAQDGGSQTGDWMPWALVAVLAAGGLLAFDVMRPRRGLGLGGARAVSAASRCGAGSRCSGPGCRGRRRRSPRARSSTRPRSRSSCSRCARSATPRRSSD